MRRIALVALVLALGCSKKNDPPPPPTPSTTPATASAPSSASGASSPSASASTASSTKLDFDRKITATDLDGKTLRELAIIRNMPYARNGKTFRKQWLSDYFKEQAWYKPTDAFDEKKLTATDKENSQFVADYEAKLTHAELEKRAFAIKARVDAGAGQPNDALELQLLSIRIGRPMHNVEVAAASSPLEDPKSLDRLLTVKELDNLSPRDLRILRNTIYARKGRPFKSPILASYFESMDWYKADEAYTDARLSAIDQKNIKIVRSVEDSLGGPMTDSQEMGWFGGA